MKKTKMIESPSFVLKTKVMYGFLAELLKSLKEKKAILDIGTGTGIFVREYGKKWNVTGVDISKYYLKLANDLKVVVGDVHELPFNDETFDVIISKSSLCYWKNPVRGINEILRVLKPNGKFLIMDLIKPGKIVSKLILIIDFLISGREGREDILDFMNRNLSIEDVESIIERVKHNIKIRRCYFGIYYILVGTK